MKNVLLFSIAALSSTAALAQNTATINQQGNTHEVTVVQRGTSNTSVISQGNRASSNSAVITQSGGNNVANITQGSGPDGSSDSQNTVVTSQSGEGKTIINQTKDGNTISVYQSGPITDSKKKKDERKQQKN